MIAAQLLRHARRGAGLSQRELAERAGTTQSAVSRIESGAVTPRFDTLAELVRACGARIGLVPVLGEGVDRTTVRAIRRLSPAERLQGAALEARNVDALRRATRRRS